MPTILSPDDAVALLPDGARVLSTPGCSTPTTLLAALGRMAAQRPGLTIVAGMLLGDQPWGEAVAAGHLRLRSWHLSGAARRLADRGQAEYVPMRLGDVAGCIPGAVDAMVLRVSPPERDGTCTIGPSGSYTLAGVRAVRAAGGLVLAEVDPDLPATTGDTRLVPDERTVMVEVDTPTCLYRPAERDAAHARIAELVLGLLPSGPTVQLGIGAVPEAVADHLGEVPGGVGLVGMAGDGVIGLLDAGVLRPRAGMAAVTAVEVLGTSALMAFVDRNPSVEVVSSATMHDPRWLAGIDRLVSVNSALEVDLGGQVALEAAGGRSLSGLGGAADFFDGAHLSPGGLRVVALRSTDRSGTATKIVPRLAAGTPVSLPRHAVDAVVTEHGVAWLRGASTRERARALVQVAAPAWRDVLAAAGGVG